MNKAIKRILALCLCLVLVCSFAACSGDKDTNSDEPTQSTADPKFDTLDEFLNDDTVKQQIESTKTANDEDETAQMTCGISSEGSTLIYTYTFKPEVDTTNMAELLEKEMVNYTSTFTNIATALSESIKEGDPQVKLVYLDSTGKEIFTKTFTPEGAE